MTKKERAYLKGAATTKGDWIGPIRINQYGHEGIERCKNESEAFQLGIWYGESILAPAADDAIHYGEETEN